VAPFEVVITVVRPDDDATMAVANQMYDDFAGAGVDVLLDDRDERPGVKFADAELIGIPYRVTVGPKGLEQGIAEVTERRGMVKTDMELGLVAQSLSEAIAAARFGI
jgi:prolyl-tRNA synthetase